MRMINRFFIGLDNCMRYRPLLDAMNKYYDGLDEIERLLIFGPIHERRLSESDAVELLAELEGCLCGSCRQLVSQCTC